MRGTWLLALVVATARGVAGVTDGAGCGASRATCGERARVAVVGGGPEESDDEVRHPLIVHDRDPEQNLEALRDPSRYRQNLA